MARRMDQRESLMRRCANMAERSEKRQQAKAAKDAERAKRFAELLTELASRPDSGEE